jgi:hypothetical protein
MQWIGSYFVSFLWKNDQFSAFYILGNSTVALTVINEHSYEVQGFITAMEKFKGERPMIWKRCCPVGR